MNPINNVQQCPQKSETVSRQDRSPSVHTHNSVFLSTSSSLSVMLFQSDCLPLFWRTYLMGFSQHGKSYLSTNTCGEELYCCLSFSSILMAQECCSCRREAAGCLMCSGVVTLAKLATEPWRKWPCGFMCLFICRMRHISTAGRHLD